MMLRHGLGRADDAARIEAAVDAVLERGLRTPDLASGTVVQPPTSDLPREREVGTEEMTAAVLEELSSARRCESVRYTDTDADSRWLRRRYRPLAVDRGWRVGQFGRRRGRSRAGWCSVDEFETFEFGRFRADVDAELAAAACGVVVAADAGAVGAGFADVKDVLFRRRGRV